MDIVVNWFIIILVIVFDPLAVSLVVAANHLSDKEKQKKVLDEITEIGQKIQPTDEPFTESQITDSVTLGVVDVPDKENVDFFQEKVLVEDHEEPHIDVVEIKKKKKRKKDLKNKKKSSILSNTTFDDDQELVEVQVDVDQKQFYGEEPIKR